MSPAAGAPAPARLVFPPGHPVFAGHFPRYPIIPGALLLDAALLAIATAAPAAADVGANATPRAAPDAAVQHLANIKFFRPAGPNEVLSLTFTRLADGRIPFEWRCGEERIASGTLLGTPTQQQGLS
jgi:3-hydroxymyristoyl/3-hydroxydecanoyl-(acyl carrier protein) dehydratase